MNNADINLAIDPFQLLLYGPNGLPSAHAYIIGERAFTGQSKAVDNCVGKSFMGP